MRDITLEDTIYPKFTTRAFATGVPTTLAGTPVLSVYEENNLTQITAGVSITADYDSVTGLSQATIAATAANGYEAGKSYDLVITTGTVGGVSVVGEVVYSFTVDASAAFTRLGAPAGASVSADNAAIKTETASILVDTGTTLDTKINDIQGGTFSSATDSLEAIRDRGDAAWTTGAGSSNIRTGTAQAGAAGTLTLDTGASAVDDFYNGTYIHLDGGTGVGQVRIVTDYVGSTKVATIGPANWVTTPDATSTFIVKPEYNSVIDSTNPISADVLEWSSTAVATPTTAGVPEVELARISGQAVTAAAAVTINAEVGASATAMDAFEDQYDGTGLTGDNYPSTQAQVGSIAVGSAAISTVAESYVLTTGTQSLNLYTDTETLNATRHEHTDTAGALELYYQFDVTGAGVATEVQIIGRMNGANDSLDGIYAYDWVGTAWDRIGDYAGTSSSTDSVENFSLLTRHTGTGANLGKVRVRFYAASGLTTSTLRVDQIFTSYAVVSQTVGYALGQVWVDTVDGTAGTESYVNGVADNPVLTFADAITIAGNLGIHDYHFTPHSTLAPAADLQDSNVYGVGYTCTLGGHDYAGTHVFHASPVTGKATTTGGADHFDVIDSIVGNVEVDDSHFTRCSFNGTITLDQVTSGDLKLIDSRSIIAGSGTPIIDCGTAAVTHSISIAHWQNGIEIRNLNNGGTNLFSISGTGQLIVASTCSGTMNVRGQWKITDNSGGSVTFVYDDVHQDIENVETVTDQMVFTKANELDTNIQSVNDVTVTGDGSGTPFNV